MKSEGTEIGSDREVPYYYQASSDWATSPPPRPLLQACSPARRWRHCASESFCCWNTFWPGTRDCWSGGGGGVLPLPDSCDECWSCKFYTWVPVWCGLGQISITQPDTKYKNSILSQTQTFFFFVISCIKCVFFYLRKTKLFKLSICVEIREGLTSEDLLTDPAGCGEPVGGLLEHVAPATLPDGGHPGRGVPGGRLLRRELHPPTGLTQLVPVGPGVTLHKTGALPLPFFSLVISCMMSLSFYFLCLKRLLNWKQGEDYHE